MVWSEYVGSGGCHNPSKPSLQFQLGRTQQVSSIGWTQFCALQVSLPPSPLHYALHCATFPGVGGGGGGAMGLAPNQV